MAGLTVDKLRKAAAALREVESDAFVVQSEAQAAQMKAECPFQTDWKVGDRYFLINRGDSKARPFKPWDGC